MNCLDRSPIGRLGSRLRLVAVCFFVAVHWLGGAAAEDSDVVGDVTFSRHATRLFDGRTLDDWEGDDKWFRVEQGCIVAGHLDRRIPHNFFLCTRKAFGDFELRLEGKIKGPGQNAGIQFRSRRVAGSTEVAGYQADMGIAWKRPVWGALYDESRRNKMLAEPAAETIAEAFQPGQWNEIRILARGPRIEIFLNGIRTIEFIEPDPAIAKTGVIGLQIHSGPATEAWYRNLRLREFH